MVVKNSELPEGDERRKYKYRLVFQGDRAVDQNWEVAIFQEVGSSPATMEASRACDCHGCIDGNDIEQADVEQAYVQALLEGPETWVQIPREWWPDSWYNADGTDRYHKPVVQLLRALYGHPDAGTFWERHCNSHCMSVGFVPIPDWPS